MPASGADNASIADSWVLVLTRVYFENADPDGWWMAPVAFDVDFVGVCGQTSLEKCSNWPTTLDSKAPPRAAIPGHRPQAWPAASGGTNGFGRNSAWFSIGVWNR
jgi:hypothetical protein